MTLEYITEKNAPTDAEIMQSLNERIGKMEG